MVDNRSGRSEYVSTSQRQMKKCYQPIYYSTNLIMREIEKNEIA